MMFCRVLYEGAVAAGGGCIRAEVVWRNERLMVAEFMHSVTQSLWTPLPTPCPLLASHTLSPSLSLPLPHSVLSPLLLICLNLSVEPPPSSPHHLSLTTSLSFSTPPYTPPCCFGAAACLLATTAHPLELSECFYKHTQEDTLIHAHTRRHTHTYAGKRKHIHTLTQGLVPHWGLLLAGLWVCKPLWQWDRWEENRYAVQLPCTEWLFLSDYAQQGNCPNWKMTGSRL